MKNTEDAIGGSLHRAGSDVRPETGQLRCPKCRALTLNVNVSDIIAANGRVTCSRCGHERTVLVNVPAANGGGGVIMTPATALRIIKGKKK
jgi:hypothetical protein